jgi:hypothetical protein
MEVSAKTGGNVQESFEELGRMVVKDLNLNE